MSEIITCGRKYLIPGDSHYTVVEMQTFEGGFIVNAMTRFGGYSFSGEGHIEPRSVLNFMAGLLAQGGPIQEVERWGNQ